MPEIEVKIPKLKIAVFSAWIKTKGGAEKQLLEYLKRTKHQIDIYTWVYEPERTFPEFKDYKIHVLGEELNHFQNDFLMRGILFGIKAFTTKIPEKNYNAILIFGSGVSELVALRNNHHCMLVYCNSPLRAALKEDIEWNLKYRFKNPLIKVIYKPLIFGYNLLEKWSWRKFNFAFSNSDFVKERIVSKKLMPSCLVKTIYSGVNLKEHRTALSSNFFLYVARFGMAKRQIDLLKAWKDFEKDYPQYRLILAGSIFGEKNTKYLDQLIEYKMKNDLHNVEFWLNETDEQIEMAYSSCIAGLNLPFREDFGLVPFEVVSYNKPLISVKTGGFHELLKNHNAIVWIDDSDDEKLPQEIRGALEKFVKYGEEYTHKAKTGYLYLKTLDLTWDNYAKQLDKEIYNQYMGTQNQDDWEGD